MLIPSKFTPLEESTIFKMVRILDNNVSEESIFDAYNRTKDTFKDAVDFMHALDVLYVLDAIEVDEPKEMIRYA